VRVTQPARGLAALQPAVYELCGPGLSGIPVANQFGEGQNALKGQKDNSPGQRPGLIEIGMRKPERLRDNSAPPIPRALPWAVIGVHLRRGGAWPGARLFRNHCLSV